MSQNEAYERAMEAKQDLVRVQIEQHREMTGCDPSEEQRRLYEEKARQSAERCMRNQTTRYRGR